jgi:PAS domain S-box-containing protein
MKLTIRNALVLIRIMILISLMVGCLSFENVAAEQGTKRVFVLNSFNRGYTWTDNMLLGIEDAFTLSGIQVETYTIFMDMKRIPPTPQYFSQLKALIHEGYKDIHFDAVLACDNDALDFMRKYRDELFPGVPVVFSSINNFNESMLDGRNDLTGTSENADYVGTIQSALKLRPTANQVVVIVDGTTTGLAHRWAVEKIRTQFPPNITFTYLSLADITLNELAKKLSQLSSNSIVLLLQHFIDKTGVSYTIQESTPLLTQSASVPVFVASDIRVGLGALGGHVVSGYAHGNAAAQMVVRILKGTDIRSIPVLLDSPNRYMFDYRVMRRFNIEESALPQGSIVINKAPSLLDAYENEIRVFVGTFIVLCGVLIYLLFEIRKRRRIERVLRENQIMLSNIINSVPQSIFWKDRTGIYLGCNQNFAQAVGISSAQIVGLTDYDLPWSRAEADAYRADDQEVISLNQPKQHIIEPGRAADGTPIWADTTKVPLTDVTGKPYGVLGVYEDITTRKQAEEEIRQLNALLEQRVADRTAQLTAANQELEAFSYSVSHDLRAPLRAMSGFSSILRDEYAQQLDEKGNHYLSRIQEASEHMGQLINDLLNLSRIGRAVFTSQQVDLSALATQVAAELKFQFPHRRLDFEIAANLIVQGDENLLKIVMENLLNNACKFTSQREQAIIQVSSLEQDGEKIFFVRDNGAGFNMEYANKLFVAFQRLHSEREFPGTGIGLATVQRIIHRHGGRVWADGEVDKGATFYFTVA